MPKLGFIFFLCACLSGTAQAQDEMTSRLSQERVGDIEPGTYSAGSVTFLLNRYDDKFLLRFPGEPEVYVLYPDRAPLGGRVLRYDSGATLIRVAGWGSLTLYTDSDPGGVPAERTGDTAEPELGPISLAGMQNAALDEATHLAYSRHIQLSFTADWNALAGDAKLRALCFDAMQNAARGIDLFTSLAAARTAFMQKVDAVRMELGGRTVIFLSGKTLNVTFIARRGYAGRASSRGIARALGKMLSVSAEY